MSENKNPKTFYVTPDLIVNQKRVDLREINIELTAALTAFNEAVQDVDSQDTNPEQIQMAKEAVFMKLIEKLDFVTLLEIVRTAQKSREALVKICHRMTETIGFNDMYAQQIDVLNYSPLSNERAIAKRAFERGVNLGFNVCAGVAYPAVVDPLGEQIDKAGTEALQ